MGDIADVLDAMVGFATTAVYPNGTSSPSVTGSPIDIGQGWPLAADLDAAMKAGRSIVSVFDTGVTAPVPQIMNNPGVIIPPAHNMSATANPDYSVTLSGTPNLGEYVSFIVNKNTSYSFVAGAGDTASTMAAGIAALVAVDHPGTTSSGSTVNVAGAGSLTVRVGAPATMGQSVWRQRQQLLVTVWAPDPSTRTQIAAPIDVYLKSNITFNLPDTSRALMTFGTSRSMMDGLEKVGEYRRDISVFVLFDTIQRFPAYEVTAFDIQITPTNAAVAITVPVTTIV